MKKTIKEFSITGYFLCVIILSTFSSVSVAQVTIGAGTTFSLGSSTFSLPGNLTINGTFNSETGTLVFNGASGTQVLTDSLNNTYYNITVDKASGILQLNDSIFIDGTLNLTSGDLDLNGKSILLGPSSMLSETPGNTVTGSGDLSGAVVLNAPAAQNVLGLGAIITSGENMGLTEIRRGQSEQSGASNTSILRYYDISPSNNSSLNATLVFTYDDSELNGKTESDLILFKSTNSGTDWTIEGGTVNTVNNTITLSGINDFSRWTAAGQSTPLPVELISFNALSSGNKVEIKWSTAAEKNNYGFNIERLEDNINTSSHTSAVDWESIGFVKGAGNSNSPLDYSYTDNLSGNHFSGNVKYRLKQIDNDGSFIYSDEVEVTLSAPKEFVLYQNYPNPFNPTTIIEFTVPDNGQTVLKIFNINGEEVATLYNGWAEAGRYYKYNFHAGSFAAGTYYVRLQNGSNQQIKKMILLK